LRFLNRFPELAQFRRSGGMNAHDPDESRDEDLNATKTPDEIVRAAHEQVDAALRQELIDRLLAVPPNFFERAIIHLLTAMGYGGKHARPGEAIGGRGDGGIDGIIDQDALGLDQVYVQAKRYARDQPIPPGAIRNFFGSLDTKRATKGVFVTTSSFSPAARDVAERFSKRITLIDGDQLARLMFRFDVGVRIEETFHVKKIDEDFFAE
jgi:restriction system protein